MKQPIPLLMLAMLGTKFCSWGSEHPPTHQLNPGGFGCVEAGLALAGRAVSVQIQFLVGGLRDGGRERLPLGSWPADRPHQLILGSSSWFSVVWRAEGRGRARHLRSPPPPPLMTTLCPYNSVKLDIWVPARITQMTDRRHGLCLAEVGFGLAGDRAGGYSERQAVQVMVWTVAVVAPVPCLPSVAGESLSSHWRHINSARGRGGSGPGQDRVWRGLRLCRPGHFSPPFLDPQTCDPLAWGDRRVFKRVDALFPGEWAESC